MFGSLSSLCVHSALSTPSQSSLSASISFYFSISKTKLDQTPATRPAEKFLLQSSTIHILQQQQNSATTTTTTSFSTLIVEASKLKTLRSRTQLIFCRQLWCSSEKRVAFSSSVSSSTVIFIAADIHVSSIFFPTLCNKECIAKLALEDT